MPTMDRFLQILFIAVVAFAEPVRICYYSNWSQYRPGSARYMPTDIDPFLCTHLIYSFAKLDTSYRLTTYEWNDNVLYEQFNGLKKTNPQLKTLLAVGGWNAGSIIFSDMVSNPSLRSTFARTTVEFLRKWDFDGFDLDWEYPALRGGRATDKQDFIKLLVDLKQEIAMDTSSKPRLLLTAAVAAGKSNVDAAYDIPQMAMYFDYINLMSYDLHGAWEDFTGFNSPLFARANEDAAQRTLNLDWAAKYWIQQGTPREKLVVGLATYGRSFQLTNPANYQPGAPAKGPGNAGQYTKEAGFLAYYEICRMLASGAKRYWEPQQAVPYLVQGDQWVGYDDEESFRVKLQYIRDEGYAGAMIWNIDLDDFNEQCPSSANSRYRKNPLMNLMKEVLNAEPTYNLPTPTPYPSKTEMPSLTATPPSETGPKRVCYYSNLSQYRQGNRKFMPANINPFLCTHLIYAFAKLDVKSELALSEWNDESLYEEFNSLKKANPALKTLLAVGGWNMGSRQLSKMANDPNLREKFARTAVTFLRKWGFDGLDVSWEFPASRGGQPSDKGSFVMLLKDLRKAFTEETTSKPRLMLSAAVSADQNVINSAYDIPNIAMYVDFATLMAYDFHGDWSGQVGHNSPLYPKATETGSERTRNVDWSTQYWVQGGFPKEKLLIGLPAYARTYQLSSATSYQIGAPIKGPGTAGMYTREPGFLAYYEVCEHLATGANRFWDQEQSVPYLVHGDQWIGYDDSESFTLKLAYIRDGGFGGATVWNLGLDDFNKQCSQSNRLYPLISLLAELLGGQSQGQQTGQSTTTWISGQTNASEAFSCSNRIDGFYSDPYDCSNSYQCVSARAYPRPCASGLVWDQADVTCTYVGLTDCEAVEPPTKQPVTVQTTKQTTTPTTTTTTTTRAPTTNAPTTRAPTTTTLAGQPSGEADCSKLGAGVFPDPTDPNCNRFLQCTADGQKFVETCGWLRFNPSTKNCDWPQKVTCPSTRMYKGR